MTGSQIGRSPGNQPLLALLEGGRLQQAPPRGQSLFGLDNKRATRPGHRRSTYPQAAPASMAGTQRWSAEWSGDQLIRVEPPGANDCLDQTGALCPKLAEARARQALAEHQLAEFNHRVANMLQMLASRVERQRRLHDVPARRDELEKLIASIRATGQLHRYLLPPRKHLRVDLGVLLMNVATAIEGMTGLVCDVDAESLNVPGQVATHLAAAVNELAWNAHKHAYRGEEGGGIRIVCRRDADTLLRLCVVDWGSGLPPDFDPRVSKGLGLIVVCTTTWQYSGTLQVESDQGAHFTLLLNTQTFEGPLP